jgi:peptide/nickel transport system permease protein
MSRVSKYATKAAVTVLLGGLLAATLVRIAPGFGVDEEELDSRLSAESIRNLRRANADGNNLGAFYLHYLGGLLHGDLGVSRTLQRPVTQLLAERFPETLKSVGLGMALGWMLGLPLAILVVMTRTWYLDLVASVCGGILLCIPAAVLALLFVILQAPGRLVLGLIVFPKVFRYSRNLLARSAAMPHILTARAKGLSGVRLFFWHIVPVAGPQLLALAGISLSIAFAAAIPVEVLCDLPGIGQLAWKAAIGRDLTLLVNLTMIVTIITVLANSASDLAGDAFRRVEA